ncbi:MAG: DsbA family protein [Pseudomonadota bacterium]|nr:DsbA family protein [Pseudomonadota bacterium]
MRRLAPVGVGVLAAAAVGACGGAGANNSDDAFGAKVRAYLLAHPEVVQEAAQRLQVKADADEAAQEQKARADLPLLRGQIERDPRDFVANPAGKITVTEFYDYRCPHCANAAPKVLALIAADPDVRFVFKEMPIFGATSQRAARAALAVKKAGGDYLGVYRTLMATHPLDDIAIDRIALAKGAKAADIAVNRAADAQLADTTALFTKLSLGGTPAFIVGDEIVYGEDMEALANAIAKAKGRGA